MIIYVGPSTWGHASGDIVEDSVSGQAWMYVQLCLWTLSVAQCLISLVLK